MYFALKSPKFSSSQKFSNRSDPKRQLEASNQFYSLLWSKKATLQTVIDNLLTHGINNQNEDISSGMVFRPEIHGLSQYLPSVVQLDSKESSKP